MFSNYLIGLREGLEAALVVGILVAYLVKTGRKDKLAPLWIGIGVAIAVSLAFGAILTYGSSTHDLRGPGGLRRVHVDHRRRLRDLDGLLDEEDRPLPEGRAPRQDRRRLALGPIALAATATIAVGREGLETALFLWTNIQATGDTAAPIIGAVLGLATAVVLGYLIYRQAIAINLSKFFTVTGALLIVVAAGVLAYGVPRPPGGGHPPRPQQHGLRHQLLVLRHELVRHLLKGIFNFSPNPTRARGRRLVRLPGAHDVPVLPGHAVVGPGAEPRAAVSEPVEPPGHRHRVLTLAGPPAPARTTRPLT